MKQVEPFKCLGSVLLGSGKREVEVGEKEAWWGGSQVECDKRMPGRVMAKIYKDDSETSDGV